MNANDLQRERERTRCDAWNQLPYPLRLAAVVLLGWRATWAWCEYGHWSASERVALAGVALEITDHMRSLFDIILPDVVSHLHEQPRAVTANSLHDSPVLTEEQHG